MDKQVVTAWLERFFALWFLMILAAGIPLSVVGMMFGSGPGNDRRSYHRHRRCGTEGDRFGGRG